MRKPFKKSHWVSPEEIEAHLATMERKYIDPRHTPRPWINDGSVRVQGDSDGHRHDIAHVDEVPFHTSDDPERERRANARLIAASPELLLACRSVIIEAKQREDYMHNTWNPDAHVELTLTIAEIRAIHAAILKATGRTP